MTTETTELAWRASPGRLPLVIGVTGHRDLRPQDHEPLAKAVEEFFEQLHQRYPHTPLILLSPLAEGADRLVAEVALQMGVRLIVPLPMNQAEYERDFNAPGSLTQFNQLIGRAEKWFELPLIGCNTPKSVVDSPHARDLQYTAVGVYVARQCQILLALWDGVDPKKEKRGGTANIVCFKLDGVDLPEIEEQNPLDPIERGIVYRIVTPRLSEPNPVGKFYTGEFLYPKVEKGDTRLPEDYDRALAHTNRFNHDASDCQSLLQDAAPANDGSLIPESYASVVPPELQTMLQTYAVAGGMAVYFRRLTTRALVGVLGLTFLALALYQFIDKVIWDSGVPIVLLAAYVASLAGAYVTYLWARFNEFQKRHLDYRALAEGFRVQIFWHLAGICATVADFYLRKQRGELEWIRHAVRVQAMLAAQSDEPTPEDNDQRVKRADAVLTCWVKNQHLWYDKAARKNEARAKKIKWLGKYIAIPVALALALAKLMKAIIWKSHPTIIHRLLSGYDDWSHTWAYGITFLIVAAIGLLQIYSKFSALSEHAKQYSRMSITFGNAQRFISDLLASPDSSERRSVLSELGREALLENGDWLLLHRDRPLEVPKA